MLCFATKSQKAKKWCALYENLTTTHFSPPIMSRHRHAMFRYQASFSKSQKNVKNSQLNISHHQHALCSDIVMPCFAPLLCRFLLISRVQKSWKFHHHIFLNIHIPFLCHIQYMEKKTNYCQSTPKSLFKRESVMMLIVWMARVLVLFIPDMIFVKSFTQAWFRTFWNLPEKTRKLRHF